MGTASHPQTLLPGLEDDLLDPDLDQELLDGLLKASAKGITFSPAYNTHPQKDNTSFLHLKIWYKILLEIY